MRLLPLVLLAACSGESRYEAPTVEGLRAVVPGDGLPAELPILDANNNLDIVLHDDRWFLAFRSAPSHFASAVARIHVVSSLDRETWSHEATFALDTDLREPQLVSFNGDDPSDELDPTEDDPYLAFQWDHCHKPKRCGVWAVDPERLEVHHALDLPGRGDTCFPEMVRLDADRLLVNNYSSDVDGPDLDWLDGQTGETLIYEQVLVFL